MRVHHLAFRTDDVGRLERFYDGVLGLGLLRRTPSGGVWLDSHGTIVMLEPRGAEEPKVAPGTMDLVAFAIEPAERAEIEGRLARAGVPIEARTAYTLYLRDPDGRRLGLSSYPDELGRGDLG